MNRDAIHRVSTIKLSLIQAILRCAWEGDDVADVGHAGNEQDKTLEAKAVA